MTHETPPSYMDIPVLPMPQTAQTWLPLYMPEPVDIRNNVSP